jgi:hypothetical protein
MDVKVASKRSNSRLNFVYNNSLPKSKRSQITIFIIIAVIIIAVIVLVLFLRKPPTVETPGESDPQTAIKSCAKEALEEALMILLPQGGDITPKGSVLYNNVERVYLCYTEENYKPCANQRPMLVEHIEQEITDFIKPKVEACFVNLKNRFSERYEISERQMQLSVKLKPGQIRIDIDKYFKMSRDDKVQEFEDFQVNMIHPMYELAEIAMEIANQEIEFCHFDNLGFMIIYPQYDITKFETGNQDTIYSVKERKSGQELTFAIRSCVMPPGV